MPLQRGRSWTPSPRSLARLLDEPLILRAQPAVAARPGVGACREAFGLRVLALQQPHARQLLPQARIARLDAQGALERGCGIGKPAGSRVGARAFHEAG